MSNLTSDQTLTRFGVIALLLWLASMTHSASAAAQCFTNVNKAYDYLVAQADINEQRAQTHIGLPVNINRASEAELVTLKGIGSKKAVAIIEYRETFGPFKRVEDLSQVKGIGAKTVEKNRSKLRVD